MQFRQPGQFRGFGGHYHLATDLVRDAVLTAELRHLANSFHCQPRLKRAGLVIQTAVEDAAVVRALVQPDRRFLFQNGDGPPGMPANEFKRGCKTNQPAANDQQLPALIHEWEGLRRIISCTADARSFDSGMPRASRTDSDAGLVRSERTA